MQPVTRDWATRTGCGWRAAPATGSAGSRRAPPASSPATPTTASRPWVPPPPRRCRGNRIGTNPAGTASRPNGTGVRVDGGSTQNVIGGTNTAERNLISGNQNYGVRLIDPGTSQNTVEGNY